jgi:hypothetical protein
MLLAILSMALMKDSLIFESLGILDVPICRAKTIIPRQANRAVVFHRFATLLVHCVDLITIVVRVIAA